MDRLPVNNTALKKYICIGKTEQNLTKFQVVTPTKYTLKIFQIYCSQVLIFKYLEN